MTFNIPYTSFKLYYSNPKFSFAPFDHGKEFFLLCFLPHANGEEVTVLGGKIRGILLLMNTSRLCSMLRQDEKACAYCDVKYSIF